MIQKGVLTPIPNHFTESNYLDSLPIETRLKGKKKSVLPRKKIGRNFLRVFGSFYPKSMARQFVRFFARILLKKKKPGYERWFARNKYLKSKLESDRTVTRGGSP